MTRMSGVNLGERLIRKGSVDAIRRHIEVSHGHFPDEVTTIVEQVKNRWNTAGGG